MTVPAATATAGMASHSAQRRTLRSRERLGGCRLPRSLLLPCGLPCWCLAARVGVIGGAAIAEECYPTRGCKPILHLTARWLRSLIHVGGARSPHGPPRAPVPASPYGAA